MDNLAGKKTRPEAAEDGYYYGARVISDQDPLQVGQTVPNSGRTVDCDPVGETLPGTSAIWIPDHNDFSAVTAALDNYTHLGKRIAIIRSRYFDYGDDPGEIVMKRAEAVSVRRFR